MIYTNIGVVHISADFTKEEVHEILKNKRIEEYEITLMSHVVARRENDMPYIPDWRTPQGFLVPLKYDTMEEAVADFNPQPVDHFDENQCELLETGEIMEGFHLSRFSRKNEEMIGVYGSCVMEFETCVDDETCTEEEFIGINQVFLKKSITGYEEQKKLHNIIYEVM